MTVCSVVVVTDGEDVLGDISGAELSTFVVVTTSTFFRLFFTPHFRIAWEFERAGRHVILTFWKHELKNQISSTPAPDRYYSVLRRGSAPAISPLDVNRASNRFSEREEFIDLPYVGPRGFVLSHAQREGDKADKWNGHCCTYQTANDNKQVAEK